MNSSGYGSLTVIPTDKKQRQVLSVTSWLARGQNSQSELSKRSHLRLAVVEDTQCLGPWASGGSTKVLHTQIAPGKTGMLNTGLYFQGKYV